MQLSYAKAISKVGALSKTTMRYRERLTQHQYYYLHTSTILNSKYGFP